VTAMQRRPRDEPLESNHLHRSVERHRARRERWTREGERPLARNLALIGSIGWLIVVPPLLGALLGRWLDRSLDTGIFWSAGLIFLGVALGGAMAWRRIEHE
jgi:ATP synthase protein I